MKFTKLFIIAFIITGLVACSSSEEDKEFVTYKSISEKVLDNYISDYKTSLEKDEWSVVKQEKDITVISSKIKYKDENPLFTIIITDMVKDDDIKFVTHFVKVGKDVLFDDGTIE